MLITKIFHLRQPVEEARVRLRELGEWTEDEADIQCSVTEREGMGRFELSTRQGQRISADVEEVPGDDPNRIMFRSVGGDIEMAGIVELYPIRPNLTEVSLTVEYETLPTPVQRVLGSVDRFLNRQLARIEGCVERARAKGGTAGFA